MLFVLWAVLACSMPARSETSPKVPTVYLQHLSTTFANQGMCSIRFGISSETGGGVAGNVEVQMRFLDPKGKVLHQGKVNTSLDDSAVGSYKEEFVEGEGLCFPDGTRVVVTKATAETNGKVHDLVKLGKIKEAPFRPYRITVAQ